MTLPQPVPAQAGAWPEEDVRLLYHRLNNQLGVVLAQAELLEAKAANDLERARAAQVVRSVLDALGTTKLIRYRTNLADSAH